MGDIELDKWQKQIILQAINSITTPCPKCGSNMILKLILHRNKRSALQCTVCKYFELYPKTNPQNVKVEGFKPSIKIIDESEYIQKMVKKNEDKSN